jgi:hypothetical protein
MVQAIYYFAISSLFHILSNIYICSPRKKSLHLLLGSHDMRAYCINTQKHSRSGEAWPDMQGRGLAYYYSHNSLKIDDLLFKQ